MNAINKISQQLLELKVVLRAELGKEPDLKIGLDPESYDRLTIESHKATYYSSSSCKPSSIHVSTIVGVPVVPWVRERF